jgi:hypothetical protein
MLIIAAPLIPTVTEEPEGFSWDISILPSTLVRKLSAPVWHSGRRKQIKKKKTGMINFRPFFNGAFLTDLLPFRFAAVQNAGGAL